MLLKFNYKTCWRRQSDIKSYLMSLVSSMKKKILQLLYRRKCGLCKLVKRFKKEIQKFSNRRKPFCNDLIRRRKILQFRWKSSRNALRRSRLSILLMLSMTQWRTLWIWGTHLITLKIRLSNLTNVNKLSLKHQVSGLHLTLLKRTLSHSTIF